MKKIVCPLLLAALFACTKKDVLETKSSTNYQIRIAAVENSGTVSYSPISRVKSGKVAIAFETAEVSEVKEYKVEVSADGIVFKTVKTLAADQKMPNRFYSDTLVLD